MCFVFSVLVPRPGCISPGALWPERPHGRTGHGAPGETSAPEEGGRTKGQPLGPGAGEGEGEAGGGGGLSLLPG